MPPPNDLEMPRGSNGVAIAPLRALHINNKAVAGPSRFPERFRQNRCLFINLWGCEGDTIHSALFGGTSPGHVPLRWYERHFPKDYAACFKFTFVRDPVERAYVAWARWMEAQLFSTAESGLALEPDGGFDGFVNRWLHDEHIHGRVDLAPQTDFLLDAQGCLKMDFIGRYETLGRDFASLRDFLCSSAALPWSASAYERPAGSRYAVSAWARRRIRQVYADDYTHLGFD